MRKKEVNEILSEQTNRRRTIVSYSCTIVIIFFAFLAFLILYLNNSKVKYISYNEDSSLDYKVYLLDNDFYDSNYLASDHDYIASLIDYIEATFSYDLSIEEEDVNYSYSYSIEALVTVNESNSDKNLYTYSEIIEEQDNISSSSNSNINLDKTVDIDYNKYNDLINKFVSLYNLDDVESILTVNMYVSVEGDCSLVEDANTETVISMSIPLTTKTVGIDVTYDLVDSSEEKLIACVDNTFGSILLLILSIVFLGIDIFLSIYLIKYIISSRTAETIYEKELKKILNNYKSYIQKINNNINLKEYKIMKVDTFTDMLEIRDTINEPILMAENPQKNGVYFVIPGDSNLLYVYSLKVNDIKQKMGDK